MKRTMRILIVMLGLCGLVLCSIPPSAYAQEFPTKPINVLVAYSPGASVDISFRALASKAEKFLGQPIIIPTTARAGARWA
jgi:tripartite-type tricarboxylate transporter receptor subunit TctC